MGRTVKLKSEIARAYGISSYTLRKWLKGLGIHNNRKNYLSSKDISILEEEFGEPDYSLLIIKKNN